jgi:MoaA/NifB/PqqE/SkfB family radical SAM enzyme
MSDVLVVQPSLRLPRGFIDYPYFVNLGAYQAAAVLREGGANVEVLDAFSAEGAGFALEGDVAWLGLGPDDVLSRVRDAAAPVVLINASPYLLAPNAREWLARVVSAARDRPGRSVVLAEMHQGGMHYTEHDWGALLASLPQVDLSMRYEGEPLLRRFVREGGGRGIWENREALALDDLPAPAFDVSMAAGYFAFLERVLSVAWRPGPFSATPSRTLPLVTSRGCPHGCVFCTKNPGLPEPRRQWRGVPLEHIDRWLSGWRDSLGLERVVVLDEMVNVTTERLDGLLSIVETLGLVVELPNGLRADRLTRPQIERLGRLTPRLKVSLESASPRVQHDVLHKDLDPGAVERVAAWCKDLHVPLDVHCLLGIPGETDGELCETVRFAARLHARHGARPLPQRPVAIAGSALHRSLGASVGEDIEGAFAQASEPEKAGQATGLAHQAFWLLASLARPRAPKVIVNLTYRCNNHCAFCAVGDRPQRDASFEDVVRVLRTYRTEGYEHLDIDGGEPTLHPDLLRVCRTAKALGYQRVTVVTNGRRLAYPRFSEKLVASGVDEVLVSLHAGSPALSAEITGDPNSFEQTVAGIRNLLNTSLDPRALAVNTTVVAKTLDHLGELRTLLRDLGVSRWNLQLVTPFGRATAGQLPEASRLTERLTGLLEIQGDPAISLVNCPPCLLPGHERAASGDFGKASRDMVFVGAEGENLQGYLSARRRPTARCEACLYEALCPGEYVFEDGAGGAA